MTRILIVALLATSLTGFAIGWYILAAPRPLDTPAPTPTEVSHRFPLRAEDVRIDRETPAIAADNSNHVVLAWASATGETERTLWVACSDDGGTTFAPPTAFRKVPIYRYQSKSKGKEVTYSTSAAPRLAAEGATIYLGWTEAIDGGPRVDFLVTRTTDGGQTFAEPLRAHGSDAVRPGFTALRAGPGGVCCSWLDSRKKSQHPCCGLLAPGADTFAPEGEVYAGPGGKGVCPCCDTDGLRMPDGTTFVAFRNNDDDYRDICVARSRSGQASDFEPPVTVNRERWRFNGCPHDGPSLTLDDGRLHVAWMDGHSGKHRIYHASSKLPDLTFEASEVCSSAPGEQGHPRLVSAGGRQHLVWDASNSAEPAPTVGEHAEHSHGAHAAGGRSVMYARLTADSTNFEPARALDPRDDAYQVNPALAVGPHGEILAAWNETTSEGKCVAFIRVPAARE